MRPTSGRLPPDGQSLLKTIPFLLSQNGREKTGDSNDLLVRIAFPGPLSICQRTHEGFIGENPTNSLTRERPAFLGPMTLFRQSVGHSFGAQVLVYRQPEHLSKDRSLGWIDLPGDVSAIENTSESIWRSSSMDPFLDSPAHVGPHSLRCSSAFCPGHTSPEQKHELFFDIFVRGFDRNVVLLELPEPPQDLSWVATEAVEELDDHHIGTASEDVFDHSEVLFPVVATSGNDIDVNGLGGESVENAVVVEPGLLGL